MPVRRWRGQVDQGPHTEPGAALRRDLHLSYERLEVVLDTSLPIFTYTADPGTRSAERLGLLGSLGATSEAERQTPAG